MEKISINIVDIDGEKYTILTEIDSSLSLMDAIRDAGFPMGNCGGMALCASCHCYVIHNHELNSQSDDECAILDQLPNSDINQSRLVCQIPLSIGLDGITLIIKR